MPNDHWLFVEILIIGCGKASYTVLQIKAAGYSAEHIKAVGYTADELKDAGYCPEELIANQERSKSCGTSWESCGTLSKVKHMNTVLQLRTVDSTAADRALDEAIRSIQPCKILWSLSEPWMTASAIQIYTNTLCGEQRKACIHHVVMRIPYAPMRIPSD